MNDIFGDALLDFHKQIMDEPLWLFTNDDAEAEEMPLEVFFRSINELNDIEQEAIRHCKGKILDIGAGAGAISLALQKLKHEVHACEINTVACEIMQKLGVKNIINQDIWHFKNDKFDTILLMMNGIGLSEKLEKLSFFLQKLHSLLKPNGQIIFDSSDISYLYDSPENTNENYFGEIKFQYRYKGKKGKPFHWLYVDIETMRNYAHETGFASELLLQNKNDEYLMRLFK